MVTVRLSDELKARIDDVRGLVPRERWVRRVLEQALETRGAESGAKADGVSRALPTSRGPVAGDSAPARASDPHWIDELQPSTVPPPGREPGMGPERQVYEKPVEGTPLPKIAPRRWAQ